MYGLGLGWEIENHPRLPQPMRFALFTYHNQFFRHVGIALKISSHGPECARQEPKCNDQGQKYDKEDNVCAQ